MRKEGWRTPQETHFRDLLLLSLGISSYILILSLALSLRRGHGHRPGTVKIDLGSSFPSHSLSLGIKH